jgi:sodium-dependent dicarboxylate transporter 2/3/5
MEENSQKRARLLTKGQIGGLVVGIALFIIFAFNLPGLNLPPAASATAGIVLMMACFWVSLCLPIPVTSLLPIILFPLFGVAGSTATVKYYADNNIYLFMGGFVIALAIEKWGLHKRIALVIVSLLGLSPGRIIFGFMCATAFLSMWISNTATTMMMLPIGLAVITEAFGQYEVENKFAVALMLGIAYSASLGGIATPIGTPPNIVFLGQYDKSFPNAPEISFFQWLTTFLPLTVILLPVVWLVLTRVFSSRQHKPKLERDIIRTELAKLGPMEAAEKRVLIVFLITALLWIFRSNIDLGFVVIPGWSNIFGHPEFFHDATVAIFMAIVLFFIPAGKKYPGQFLMNWSTAVKLPWGILLLFGGGFAIAGGFTVSGLSEQIGLALKPYLVFHPLIIVLIICLLLTFLTELTSNTATAAALLPIMAGTALALKYNPLLLMLPATISASMAFMLPVATPPNAIVFSSGYIRMSQMAKAGLILNLTIALIIASFVYFVVMPAWGLDLAVPAWIK